MHEAKPLERRLREDEGLRLLERDHVGRARQPVEEPDLAEEVARLEHAHPLRPVVSRHQDLERPARDDEEASVELALADGVLARPVAPGLGVAHDDSEVGLVQVGEERPARALAAGLGHSTPAEAPWSITPWTTP